MNKKKPASSGKLIIAAFASYVCAYISGTCFSSRLEYNYLFVGLGASGVRGNERNT